jgi:ANTAR domain
MTGKHDRTDAGARSRSGPVGVPESGAAESGRPPQDNSGRQTGQQAHTGPPPQQQPLGPANDGDTAPIEPVARRTATGWRVGDEEVPDLTSAMVLADLLAEELSAEDRAELDAAAAASAAPPAQQPGPRDAATRNAGQIAGPHDPALPAQPAPGSGMPRTDAARQPGRPGAHRRPAGSEAGEAEQLKETVAQLERALTVRVRVEQAIGVLAERHRIRPRQAFELLRSASRARGQRIMETASQVIASATNPLLRLPEELAKPPMPRRMPRRSRGEA